MKKNIFEAPPLLQFRNAELKIADKTLFNNLSFTLSRGEFVYLIGKTGSGKTSILRSIFADLPLTSGELIVNGYRLSTLPSEHIPYLRRSVGIIFQDFQLFMDRDTRENLRFVLHATGWRDKVRIQRRIEKVLSDVSLENVMYKYPYQLSGGEQQRLCIARALLNQPTILLADEPTGNLDPEVANEVMQLFHKINAEGTCIFMATHNHGFLDTYPHRTLFCKDGEVLTYELGSSFL